MDKIKVITCPHTGHEVLFDIEHEVCLHNDTVQEDLAAVAEFNLTILN